MKAENRKRESGKASKGGKPVSQQASGPEGRPQITQIAQREPRRPGPTWLVKLICIDDDGESDMILPFVPVAGLFLQVPFWDGDFQPISEVYWYDDLQRFDVYFELPPERE